MLIRVGFEIEVACTAEVPMLLSLSTHPEAKGRLIGEDRVRAEPEALERRPEGEPLVFPSSARVG